MKPLHAAHSGYKPSTYMSSFTHSPSLPAPTLFSLTTSTFLQADTRSSPLLRSKCPNHLNLPCQYHLSHTLNTLKTDQFDLTSLPILQRHHTSISPSYALLSPGLSMHISAFIAHDSVPYVNTLWTYALKLVPFMWAIYSLFRWLMELSTLYFQFPDMFRNCLPLYDLYIHWVLKMTKSFCR